MLKDGIEKKTFNLEKRTKNNISQYGLTFQIHDLGHENLITPWKQFGKTYDA
jgi:hypothetical protein